MSNPLFQNQIPNPFGNMANIVSEFNKFKKNYQGNPEMQVRNLLQSGQMSQEQFDQLSELAKSFQNMLR